MDIDLAALGRVVKLPAVAAGDGIYDALARTGDEKAVPLLIERARQGNSARAGAAIHSMGAAGEAGLRKAMGEAAVVSFGVGHPPSVAQPGNLTIPCEITPQKLVFREMSLVRSSP